MCGQVLDCIDAVEVVVADVEKDEGSPADFKVAENEIHAVGPNVGRREDEPLERWATLDDVAFHVQAV